MVHGSSDSIVMACDGIPSPIDVLAVTYIAAIQCKHDRSKVDSSSQGRCICHCFYDTSIDRIATIHRVGSDNTILQHG